ncbi:MAG: VWA domain-containing protein [Desulfobacteraceae bacterium]|jgi:uncharacterized protein with von Willebrand factor type A (vWA) domain|nr:MAG: VWA domain-containing protein [Desulfobacteraceae bacterium]
MFGATVDRGPHISNASSYRKGIAERVVRFALFLKDRGFKVYQNSIIDALRSLLQLDMGSRDEFMWALRANFVSRDEEWNQFGELFRLYWGEKEDSQVTGDGISPGPQPSNTEETVDDGETEGLIENTGEGDNDPVTETRWLEGVAYSALEALEKKNFNALSNNELQTAQLALRGFMQPFKLNRTRRSKRSQKRGKLDFPRIMRESLKRDGNPSRLYFKEKKRRLKRLVILADVSGSMDRYARFVMPFLLGLRSIGARAEVFVFSTSLTVITRFVRHLSLEKALERISREVPDWSGGTRIGFCLRQFNQGQGKRLMSRRSVVVILSDGWDLGGREILVREMAALRKKVFCVLWLNPIESDPDLRSVCRGMQAALPYIDHVLPADNLQSLRRVGHLLSRLMVH